MQWVQGFSNIWRKRFILLEHRMGFEPMNTGFADQRVSHFAIGASGNDRNQCTNLND